jgi:hypothetical protein
MTKRPLNDTRLIFNEKKHEYYLKSKIGNGDQQLGRTPRGKTILTPVTTFVKSFFRPFNEKEIAVRVAMGRKYSGVDPKCTMRKVLSEWKAIAADGTKVHKEIEEILQGNPKSDSVDLRTVRGIDALYSNIEKDFKPLRRYPELRVYSEAWKIAGTIDLLLIDELGRFVIVDWKTNRTLRFEGDPITDGPIKGLMECNFDVYQLQLSTYAALLEREYGLQCNGLFVVHLTNDSTKVIPVDYKKSIVTKMVESWQNKK